MDRSKLIIYNWNQVTVTYFQKLEGSPTFPQAPPLSPLNVKVKKSKFLQSLNIFTLVQVLSEHIIGLPFFPFLKLWLFVEYKQSSHQRTRPRHFRFVTKPSVLQTWSCKSLKMSASFNSFFFRMMCCLMTVKLLETAASQIRQPGLRPRPRWD